MAGDGAVSSAGPSPGPAEGTVRPSGTPDRPAGWTENRPTRGFRWPDLAELWQYRELAGFLALRDLRVRYKQAVFGAIWAIVQPLAGVVVFTIVFRRFAGVPSDGIPYPIFALAGLAIWSYASASVTRGTQSLVGNSALVTKVYFPRILAPIAAVFPGLLDLLLSLLILAVLMPAYGIRPTWALLTVPLWLVCLMVVSLGMGLLLGTLNVSYRDVTQGIALIVQLWMFVTPVAYPSSLVPDRWRAIFFLNPMAGVVEGSRWALVGTPWPGPAVFISIGTALLVLVAGIAYFQRMERRFADVI
jgi:lipopolysaccharide transport system permease protein